MSIRKREEMFHNFLADENNKQLKILTQAKQTIGINKISFSTNVLYLHLLNNSGEIIEMFSFVGIEEVQRVWESLIYKYLFNLKRTLYIELKKFAVLLPSAICSMIIKLSVDELYRCLTTEITSSFSPCHTNSSIW